MFFIKNAFFLKKFGQFKKKQYLCTLFCTNFINQAHEMGHKIT